MSSYTSENSATNCMSSYTSENSATSCRILTLVKIVFQEDGNHNIMTVATPV